jgi:hypothetical protein
VARRRYVQAVQLLTEAAPCRHHHPSGPAAPADPPGIHAKADEEIAHRFSHHPGPQRRDGYAYQVVEDGYEAVRGWSDGKRKQEEEKRLLDEATDALAEEYAQPVIDRRKERDQSRTQRD